MTTSEWRDLPTMASAWELWVRRPDTEWRRYSVYEAHEQAKATMKRVQGPPLELKIVPLYAKVGAS